MITFSRGPKARGTFVDFDGPNTINFPRILRGILRQFMFFVYNVSAASGVNIRRNLRHRIVALNCFILVDLDWYQRCINVQQNLYRPCCCIANQFGGASSRQSKWGQVSALYSRPAFMRACVHNRFTTFFMAPSLVLKHQREEMAAKGGQCPSHSRRTLAHQMRVPHGKSDAAYFWLISLIDGALSVYHGFLP